MRGLAWLIIGLLAGCSTNNFSEQENDASQCFAIAIAFKEIIRQSGAPLDKLDSAERILRVQRNRFEKNVADLSSRGGDLNSYTALTKRTASLVNRNPQEWREKYLACQN